MVQYGNVGHGRTRHGTVWQCGSVVGHVMVEYSNVGHGRACHGTV